ncbi:hypothetical protein J7373_18440 [Xanthomonas sp. A2111]|uniref:Uncharacterized protein n=1 Tax=Xanthomonas hawaiiensis TaxID=3003247 RepID=A0ABU2I0P6_9XANT|nr:hypothetical protein [Xanthomonas sp. A2111]MBO9830238.1 hypothetical protein [Xanthomonas sp. A2111]MDS9991710.1 hypothetical protein [Xanthomonas sp. A2111]
MKHVASHLRCRRAVRSRLSLVLLAGAAFAAQAQGVPNMNVPTEIINDLWDAKALLVTGGQGAGCYLVANGHRIAGPTLRTNIRYTAIGMATADCAVGSGIASVNLQFLARPRPAGMYIQIVDNGIVISNR